MYGNTGEEQKCWPWASASHAHALEAYDQAGSGESTGVVARVWKESMRWHEPAIRELLQGAKTGHWIWDVFPTHVRHAAGSKPDSTMRSLAEASEYLSHHQLRRNYLEVLRAAAETMAYAAFHNAGPAPYVVFEQRSRRRQEDAVDACQDRASLTLFQAAAEANGDAEVLARCA
jgi:uncharacterized protein (DUF1810 family)